MQADAGVFIGTSSTVGSDAISDKIFCGKPLVVTFWTTYIKYKIPSIYMVVGSCQKYFLIIC